MNKLKMIKFLMVALIGSSVLSACIPAQESGVIDDSSLDNDTASFTQTMTETQTSDSTNTATQTNSIIETTTQTSIPTDTQTQSTNPTETQTQTDAPTQTNTETEAPTETQTDTDVEITNPIETDTEIDVLIPDLFTLPAKIEAEFFNNYFDSESLNKGQIFRTDEGVDIQQCEDLDCGYNIAWTDDGEWLEYTIVVETAGNYQADIRLASPVDTAQLSFDINNTHASNLIVANTNDWQNWETQSVNLGFMDEGTHTLRLNILSGSVNLNWLEISQLVDATLPENCTNIDSLTELQNFLDSSDVCVKMAPGTYRFDTTNVGEGLLFSHQTVLLFTGSNSTFIFDGVTFEYDTNIFRQFGRESVWEFQIAGSNSIYKNLTMTDIGDVAPYNTAESVIMDGADNLIEGFTITARGSYPYGYGDIFGKGSTRVLNHRKHAGILIRGDRNHLKDTELFMRAYGHGIFVQGGDDVLIENVYVEGQTSTVGAVLAEAGTGTDADGVDFLTVWGYYLNELTEDYRFSLQEDGIRAYASGLDYATGEERDTGSITVLNSTVKFMRSGVTIGWAKGDKYAENITSLGNESGFWVGSDATVVNSRGDSSIGPLISEDVYRDSSTIEVTILDDVIEKIGNTPSFYLAGSLHNITIHDGTTKETDITIQVGGTRYGHRWLEGSVEVPPYISADDLVLINTSNFPVVLGANVSNTVVNSCSEVSDLGMNNIVNCE